MGNLTVKTPPDSVQVPLFDLPIPTGAIPSAASARTRYGQAVEEWVVALLGLKDIPNSGSHDVVFDAWGYETYVEVKSIHKNGQCPLYDWRLSKDKEAAVPLVYVFAIHECRRVRTMEGVYQTMADTLNEILVVPHHLVARAAKRYTVRQLVPAEANTRMGYKRAGYCEGYRNVPLNDMRRMRYAPPITRTGSIYGLTCRAKVRVHSGLRGAWGAIRGT